ncbi:MAG: DUF4129 domain-containing protein, partial [Thiothrix sp.]|nr:DUF4129 domain-containing protein [Thiothrix sp.]
CTLMQRQGVARRPDQTPGQFAQYIARHKPELAQEVWSFTRAYEALCYEPEAQSEDYLPRMREYLRQLKSARPH